ncbi:hypothetical protein V2J09_008598 [Rumex salicifolius]
MSSLGGRKFDAKKNAYENGGGSDIIRRSISYSRPMGLTGERTVKRLRLSKALTLPETINVFEACQKMASRRVDALLLTDSNALLCGILTDKDIAARVIACELDPKETPVSRVMTKNPAFVLSDTLAVEALQKMVKGKFRHLPVIENGEVVALLDIAKCLYDAIARMERAAEKGKAIAAAIEGVERSWGPSVSGSNTFIDALRDRVFKPSLSTVLSDHSKFITVSPTDTVLVAAKKIQEFKLSCAVVTVENKPRGIFTSKDILMRVIAKNLPTKSTLVEEVMTPNPECATVDTPIVDALHTMHNGNFLHLPIVDKDGCLVAVVDVINITHAAVTTVSCFSIDIKVKFLAGCTLLLSYKDMSAQVGNSVGINNEVASNMVQTFWDTSTQMGPTDDDEDTRSEGSLKPASEVGVETGRSFPYSNQPNTFAFKFEDRRGRIHRFICDTRSLTDLITCVLQRVGDDIDRKNLPQILYEDEDHDFVILASDSDLAAGVDHARAAGLKGLRLHLDYSGSRGRSKGSGEGKLDYAQADAWAAAYSTVAAGAALVAGLGVLAFLKRNG